MIRLYPAVLLMIFSAFFSGHATEDPNDLSFFPLNQRVVPIPIENIPPHVNRPLSPPAPHRSFFEGRQLNEEDQRLLHEFMNLAHFEEQKEA